MIEPFIITLLPALFLVVLFGGGQLFRRRNIDMNGQSPINRKLFYSSKYLIVVLWGAMVSQSWGFDLSLVGVPSILKKFSVLLWLFGFVLLFIGRFGLGDSFRIGSPKESTALRVNGLFKLSRNPMYLGVYATLLALFSYTLNPILLFIGIFVAVVHHRIVLAEEQQLRKVFGKEYVDYCARVRRYL
jgi:protein-S-isoprenylcysteine O-methyltransferase Ste14